MPRLTRILITAAAVTALGGAADAHAQGASCRGVAATIVGTEGPNRITGTAGRDVIVARGGDDLVNGAGGNDLICGGGGDDRLAGSTGTDTLDGGPGNDACPSGETRFACQTGVQTTFMPTRHGFPFVNHFTAIPTYETPFGPIGLDYGLCGGMAFAALDNWRFDENAPGLTQQTFNFLWSRLIDSLTIFGGVNLARYPVLQNMTNAELVPSNLIETNAIKTQLNTRPTPVGVIIPSASGPIWANHQVLAIGWFVRNGGTVLKVYDPNHPDVISYLDVNARTLGPNDGSTPQNIRGLFHELYTPATTPW